MDQNKMILKLFNNIFKMLDSEPTIDNYVISLFYKNGESSNYYKPLTDQQILRHVEFFINNLLELGARKDLPKMIVLWLCNQYDISSREVKEFEINRRNKKM